ncbi:LysM peptidoglycan-binding domain-containing protein [Fictibacillus phosphorivorans]|uniref:LysM peptidoglycan-binding domain-containing protein n=1 Tax=Fictibacillus phosphorivorans TaxID=1221500 RepID=UPI0012939C1B|nr:LysM peptidoglycan-binding domain-containing protein [Fictibacillus phosphorivorans]MQR95395.1 LysM peptidoglycan-binding domain-containing protein [Fictibacillus phosphorivorans]
MSQSKLRFSIEESVWLKKGQEVAEVLSMSLDPEIRITEEAGQVYIKGALILNGRYRCEKQELNDGVTDQNALSESMSYRSLTQLNVAEDGMTDLVHRFPVDITIPSYRVEDSNEVKVEVESFEYELPNSTCFELSASICIYGIKDEKQRQESQSYEPPKEAVRTSTVEERASHKEEKQDIFTPFQFEARQSGGVPSQSSHLNEFAARFEEKEVDVRSEKTTSFEFKPHFEAQDDRTMEATFDSLKAIAFSVDDTRNNEPSSLNETEDSDEEPSQFYGEVEEMEVTNDTEAYDHVEGDYESYDTSYQEETGDSQSNSPQYEETYHDTNRPYTYNPYQQHEAYQQQTSYQNQSEYQQQEGYQHQETYQQQNAYQQPSNPYGSYQYQQNVEQRPSYGYGEQSYEDEQEYENTSYNEAEEDQETTYESYDTSYEEYESEAEPIEVNKEREEPRDENALYLTKMLSAKEDRFSKMKMYILQRGDSLEHICERYDISLNTLMRMNQLQQGEVSEGQIIYIPVSSR